MEAGTHGRDLPADDDSVCIRVEHLEVSYGAIRALHGVSIEVRRGEVVALIGANAAGKSTLLNAIAGLVAPKGGRISIPPYGDITRMPSYDPGRPRGVVVVPEGRGMLSRLTVGENLAMGEKIGAKRATLGGGRRAVTVIEVFDVFPVLKERRTLQAGHLSGGEQQMLAIARALLMDPDILLIDEPSIGLAPILVGQIFQSLSSLLEKRHVTIVLAEQNTEIALDLSDRAYVLQHGDVVLSGTAEEVARDPNLGAAYLSH